MVSRLTCMWIMNILCVDCIVMKHVNCMCCINSMAGRKDALMHGKTMFDKEK